MIVIAPILVVWFGFGIGPKIAIIALICFFPIAVNALDGLATTPPEQRKLMRSLGAGGSAILTMLEAPTALPFVLSGAKIAVAVAVIGAVFGEWAGADDGLGHLMLVDNAQLEVARLFAAMVWLSAMAIALFALLSLIERRIAWWGEPRLARDDGGGTRRDARRRRRCSSPRSRHAGVLRPAAAADGRAGGGEPLRPRARLLRQPRPRRDLRGRSSGATSRMPGLDVRPQVPSDPSAPIKQVAAGRVDLAISYEPEVMLARDQGLDVVAVGALVDGPLTSLISLPEAASSRRLI